MRNVSRLTVQLSDHLLSDAVCPHIYNNRRDNYIHITALMHLMLHDTDKLNALIKSKLTDMNTNALKLIANSIF